MTQNRLYEFGPFRLDAAERVLATDGRPLLIAPKTLDVLIVLVQNRGHIVEKEELMRKVWPNTFIEDNNLAYNVSALRKLFGDSNASPRYIETVPRRGYRFIAEVVEAPAKETPASAAPPNPVSGQPPPVHASSRRAYWRIIASALLVIAVVASAYRFRAPAKPRLTDKDLVVLADFTNPTGDPVFDGALREGLAIQLQQSPFLSLISEERIRQMLRLMGQPADARLTSELARQVCERTGSAAVLEGSIARLGSSYVLGLRAKDCRTGNIVDREQAQAARKEDVLNALSQIASKFRVRVGESLSMVKKHSTPLAEATTPSLEALKLYSTAWKVLSSTGDVAALPLFKRALEIDPKFAMAYASLARLYSDGEDPALAAESTRKAYELRDRASSREKFLIAASYDIDVTGNLEKAEQTCEAWSQAYPRDVQVHGLLPGIIYPTFAKYEEAVEQATKAIELDPDFAIAYEILAYNYQYLGRLNEAEDAIRRATGRKLRLPEFLLRRYDLAFLNGDQAGMEREAALARGNLEAEEWMADHEAFVLAYSGHLQQARRMSERAGGLALRRAQHESAALYEVPAALWAAFFGNAPDARRSALAALELSKQLWVEYGAAFALAVSGNSARAQALANDLETRFGDDTGTRFSYLPVLRAQLALNYGEPPKAVELLQIAAPYELGAPRVSVHGFFGALYPVYVRGEAYLAARRGAEAAAEFQKILDHRGIVVSDPIGAVARLQLGRAFALSGEKTKAKAAYEAFLTLWKDADPNIPILKQAKVEYAKL